MKLAILGGSFNPVHIGHIALADAVLSNLDYDRIIFIPAFVSPFKQGAEGGSPQDRLDMLLASIVGNPHFTIDDSEIRRKGVSYTIDTLDDITRRYCPEGKLGLILGDDLIADFSKWRRSSEIIEKADIIVARRIFSNVTPPFPCKVLDNAVLSVSSEMIRNRISRNENWQHLVPNSARSVIEERGLYGGAKRNLEIIRMEETVRGLVSPSRFIHSRNTALLSFDLCFRYSFDPEKGYLAGVIHDICKSFPVEELIELSQKDGEEISEIEKKKPSLLHARAGAVLLKETFGIKDDDVLEAVRYHTTGNAKMGTLAKIVYIADKIEVNRPEVKPEIRGLCQRAASTNTDLNYLFSLIVNETVNYLRSKETDISEGTLRLLDSMQKRKNW
jgi:nicotinate-nucleotide adenylyltransferase